MRTERESKGQANSDTMLPIGDVAKRLGVSLSMAHKLVRSGEIASYRFGGCRRVSERQLQAYIESCLADEQDPVTNCRLKYF